MKDHRPLRFVLLCDSISFQKWQGDCLRELIESELAVPVGVVVNASAKQQESKWKSRWRNRKLVLWRLFSRIYVDAFSKATVSEDWYDRFRDVPKISERPIKFGKFGQRLSDETIGFVRDTAPDFILRMGFGILKGEILKAAPFGVWSYHHGDPTSFRGQPPGFWEIYSGSAVTGSVLQLLTEELDAGVVLHRGFFQTTPHSYAKTRDTIYFGSSSWVRRTCAAIQENGWPLRASVATEKGPVFKQPTNLQMIIFLARTVARFVRNQWVYRLCRQHWTCGVVPAPISTVVGLNGAEEQRRALEGTNWMKRLPHSFVADPFGYEVGDGLGIMIVFELFDRDKNKGVIASTRFCDQGFGDVKLLMESPAHLSYPFVIHDGDDVYFMPEHAGARNVSAFRLNRAGLGDEKTTILADSELLDSTILKWQGRYWLFGLDDSRSKNSDLHIYFAEHWRGPWLAHPLNPVKTDVRNSRPAGTPFVHEGRLYRPAQDCSTHYGSATVLNEIVLLTVSDFEERAVARIQPQTGSEYSYGLHTISTAGSYTLIDGAKRLSRFW